MMHMAKGESRKTGVRGGDILLNHFPGPAVVLDLSGRRNRSPSFLAL